MSTWMDRIRQPLCGHRWEVIGHLIDRHEGYRVVVACRDCGARSQVPPGHGPQDREAEAKSRPEEV